ncbi:DUF1289 domain-containing protein [Shewanella litorisediminis]|uniref:DUF1289 domain-containing protein n=1 Tax=Shewanella litorisediminis TaxID=1173586 RepID=A0ABX7G8A8_9GAMM|nr:DUF1289 domain-containing protein [Shewanella litorisediminis]MCL2916918.1 DUF1289 domain-containing protein [Shewanella litorisediminis]QRH03589.1 DUF1289 domain-containing protein [Shewanella litorisediminis]
MQSPCVARCGLNDDDYCMGCLRHIDEIVGWSQASEERKLEILASLPARRKALEGENNQPLSRAKWLESEARLGLD